MTATSVLDDQTATAIREALTAMKSGRLEDAVQIGERALAAGGEPAAITAMLGAILCGSGKLAEGVEHLRVAHRVRPNDPVIAANLATALSELGDYESALAVATKESAGADKSLRLQRIRGFAAQQLNDHASAIEAYASVVEAEPADWETWNNLGNARSGGGDPRGGVEALRRAVELNPDSAPTRLNLCRALREAGDWAEAETELIAMAADFPDDAKPLIDLHDLLHIQGRDDRELEDVLERALEREPNNVELLLALGRRRVEMFAMVEAEGAFRAVLNIDPANDDAFIGLMMIGETSRPEMLEGLPAEAESAGVGPAAVNLIRAYAHRRAKRWEMGLAALSLVPEDFEPARRSQVEGQLLDALEDTEGAFAAFQRMNEAQSEDPSSPLQRAAGLRDRLVWQLGLTARQWIDSWSAPALQPSRPAPVFLVGFPRSGTTLLDTMLMGHPNVEIMEERPILSRIDSEIGDYESIATLDEAQVSRLQDRYFELAAEHASLAEGILLIDKAPLALNRAVLAHRLFPEARFILALRHPADVVLSCFMTNFRLNSSMANFLDLETSADFYDLTFRSWENARRLLPLDVHTVRYERIVEDPASELRPLIEALGLEWHDNVLDHQRTAEDRGVISTASYAQVTQSLYRSASGRWTRYRKHLEPILPTLRPWIEKFGYSLQ